MRSCHQVLKACLNLDDGALSWVMSQILAQKGPVVQEAGPCLAATCSHEAELSSALQAMGHEEETHPQESVRSRSKASNPALPTPQSLPVPAASACRESRHGLRRTAVTKQKTEELVGFFSAPPCVSKQQSEFTAPGMDNATLTCSGRLRNQSFSRARLPAAECQNH